MPEERICSDCGAKLSPDTQGGLCVRCLFSLGLNNEAGTEVPSPAAPITEKPGDRIGRYKLLQKIGEGGCGVVYMAEQEEPVRRRVALKVIKLGMDTREVIARFEAERQALAMMDHPNIAKIFDAGVTVTPLPASGHPLPSDGPSPVGRDRVAEGRVRDGGEWRGAGGEGLSAGRPYFVMELVRGVRITEYCDQHNLPTRERLDLFIKVCQAIQHAHQKGIIHRDIKPSNILVTVNDGQPVPKVIDFGIAKATEGRLTDKTLFTAFQQFLGTPAYMSPEQAEMTSLDIDTRSDIYSLGVLLYELLTGKTPFDAKELLASGLDALRRTIREQEPAKPSTRLSTMCGDDLTTVAKHRQADPPKLISLVRGDLDWIVMKCLEKERTRRYETANGLAADLQRHLKYEAVLASPPGNLYRLQKTMRRHKLAFAAASAVVVALVIGLGVSTWLFLREKAARKSAQTEATKSRQIAQFLQHMLMGVSPSVALGRDTAMLREILDTTAERVAKDLKDQPEVEAELRDTLGNVYFELALYPQAEAMHREALRLRRLIFGPKHRAVSSSLNNVGTVLYHSCDLAGAEAMYREALAISRNLPKEHALVASQISNLAGVLSARGDLAGAEAMHREALAMDKKLLGEAHPHLVIPLCNLAFVLIAKGDLAGAKATIRDALAIGEKLGKELPSKEYPYVPSEIYDLLAMLEDLGAMLDGRVELARVEAMIEKLLAVMKKLLGNDHPVVETLQSYFAGLLQEFGKLTEAETMFRDLLALQKKVHGNEHALVAETLNNLAWLLQKGGKLPEAEKLSREALAIQRNLYGTKHLSIANSLDTLATVLLKQGKVTEAENTCHEALVMEKELLGIEHTLVASSLGTLASVFQKQGKFTEAETTYREALSMQRTLLGSRHPAVAHSLNGLARVLNDLSKMAEAKGLLLINDLSKRAEAELMQKEAQEIAFDLERQGNLPEAEALLREALTLVREASANGANGPTKEIQLANLALILHHLADVLRQRKVLAEARSLAEEAAALYQSHAQWLANEREHAREHALQVLAAVLTDLRDFAVLETLQREELEALRVRLPADDPELAGAVAMLTLTLLAEEKFTEAEPLARECLTIREKKLLDDWRTFNTRSQLGGSLLGQKKYAEAKPSLLSGYEGMKEREHKIPAVGKPRLKEALQRLVQLYEATGESDKAAEWKEKLENFEKQAGSIKGANTGAKKQ